MKRIYLIISLLCLSGILMAQTGVGWGQQRSKVNFKDSINIANGWMIGGVIVLPSVAEINYIDGVTSAIQSQINGKLNISDTAGMLTPYMHVHDTADMLTPYINRTDTANMLIPYVNHNDTASMLLNYPIKPEITTEINDSLDAIRADAVEGVAVLDSVGNTVGNPEYYATPTYVESYIGSGGNGSFTGEILQFIIGTTTGAPTTADSTIIHSGFVNKHTDVYRDGVLAYWNIGATANTTEGFRKNTTSDTIYVNPLWQDDEKIEIRIREPNTWSYLSLEGQTSTLLTGITTYLKLDEASGYTLDDATDNQNFYSIASTAAGSGIINYGRHLTATTFIRMASNTATSLSGSAFTLSFWVYLDSTASDMGRDAYLLQQANTTAPTSPITAYIDDADDKISFRVYNSASALHTVRSTTALVDSTWYHIVLQNQGAGDTIKIYINSVDRSATNVLFVGTTVSADGYMFIGRNGNTATSTALGNYDEIAIWRGTAISKALINNLYTKQLGGITYPFVE